MSSYLTSTEADAIAATMPATLLVAYIAALAAVKATALELASLRFDAAYRYQGRKYDPAQVLEFPRIAYESGLTPSNAYPIDARAVADTIWDWDFDEEAAIVPVQVLRAVLFEADSILAGSRSRIAQAMHDGLASQSVGGMSESYRPPTDSKGAPVLCLEADVIARKYRRASGRIL